MVVISIEMPKKCEECPLKDHDRLPASCVFRRWQSLSVHDTPQTNDWCPLVEVVSTNPEE